MLLTLFMMVIASVMVVMPVRVRLVNRQLQMQTEVVAPTQRKLENRPGAEQSKGTEDAHRDEV